MLKKYLTSLLTSVNGCSAILVYDTHNESNPIFRVGELTDNETNAIKQNIGVFNSSIERAEKLSKTSSSKTIMAFYNHHQLFIFSKGTIVFIVVATAEANAGMILNLKSYLEPLVSELLSNNSFNEATTGLASAYPPMSSSQTTTSNDNGANFNSRK
jgi:predicted regulator of Ras-like GTPase activity (Roadblock/LC7/MglB family)